MAIIKKGKRKLIPQERHDLNQIIRRGQEIISAAKRGDIASDIFLKRAEAHLKRSIGQLKNMDPGVDLVEINKIISEVQLLEKEDEKVARYMNFINNELPTLINSFRS